MLRRLISNVNAQEGNISPTTSNLEEEIIYQNFEN